VTNYLVPACGFWARQQSPRLGILKDSLGLASFFGIYSLLRERLSLTETMPEDKAGDEKADAAAANRGKATGGLLEDLGDAYRALGTST